VANKQPDPLVPARFDQIVGHETRPWGVRAIAYGIRHKPGRGKLTVYEVADRRLPEIVAEDLRNREAEDRT
jgi:hypothetical protein